MPLLVIEAKPDPKLGEEKTLNYLKTTLIPTIKSPESGIHTLHGGIYTYVSEPDLYTIIFDIAEPTPNLDNITKCLGDAQSIGLSVCLYSPISSLGVDPVNPVTAGPPFLLVVGASTKDEEAPRAEFHKWYEEEHIPLLSKIPDFIRARRWRLGSSWCTEGGEKPNEYLAVYDIASLDFLSHPKFAEGTSTPWMQDIIKTCIVSKKMGHCKCIEWFP